MWPYFKLESPLWFSFWFSLIFKELWLVNVFFWLIHQSLISWFYYLIEYSGVWSVINHVATYQYWETLHFYHASNLLFVELVCKLLWSKKYIVWYRGKSQRIRGNIHLLMFIALDQPFNFWNYNYKLCLDPGSSRNGPTWRNMHGNFLQTFQQIVIKPDHLEII